MSGGSHLEIFESRVAHRFEFLRLFNCQRVGRAGAARARTAATAHHHATGTDVERPVNEGAVLVAGNGEKRSEQQWRAVSTMRLDSIAAARVRVLAADVSPDTLYDWSCSAGICSARPIGRRGLAAIATSGTGAVGTVEVRATR